MTAVQTRTLQAEDWPAVRAIYEQGLATGNATFQTVAPSWADWDAAHLAEPRLLAERDGVVLGWAVLAAISSRPVYRGVAEVSVYIATEARGQGVGLALMQALIHASEQRGFWTLIAGVFPENSASLALHTRAGFRIIGQRERIGQLHGRWRDVVLLERRSTVVGV